jgi:hypothetical protein
MLCAHLKRILNLTRLRLSGMSGAHDEFLLAAILKTSGAWRNPGVHRHWAAEAGTYVPDVHGFQYRAAGLFETLAK